MENLSMFLITTTFLGMLYIIYQQTKTIKKVELQSRRNTQFLESIEKYIEIFNEQNVHELISENNLANEDLATQKIKTIRDDYRIKLLSKNETLTDEHEILIDFITLSLSLLIKTPPSLRERIIDENTDNSEIKSILKTKLDSINNHYIPVSMLEVAIAREND